MPKEARKRPFRKVLVVGAGPSGLLLSLLLAKHGIDVEVFEASDEPDDQPRAAVYGPAAVPELRRAGIIDVVRRDGMSPTSVNWRLLKDGDEDHPIVTHMSTAGMADVDGQDLRMVCFVLYELDRVLSNEFIDSHLGTVHWGHRVADTGQDEKRAWVKVETPDGPETFYGDYIVGCDGAGSRVRKSLFGDEFPGYTWDRQIVATNMYYDFEKFGWNDSSFVLHPEHFFLAAKITPDGMYRVTYGESSGLTWEEIKERQAMKLELILPGHPKPNQYKVISTSPYRMHQRCAPSFRVGRILLAADAAHLCNPWGGMGITGGFVDVGGLYDCLAGIWDDLADESILDLYSEKRIERWRNVINPISTANFRRVSDPNPETLLERDPVLRACKAAENDPDAQKRMAMASLDLCYDFTQHYKKDVIPPTDAGVHDVNDALANLEVR